MGPSDPATKPDPVIDEIRAIKRSISEQFGHDVRKLCLHLRKEQDASTRRVVRRKPVPPVSARPPDGQEG
jgi:hypothetical protein